MTHLAVCSDVMTHELVIQDPTEGSGARRFARGFSYPFRGARTLLTHPRLWPYVIIPALITLATLVFATLATFTLTPLIIHAIWHPSADYAWYWRWLWIGMEFFTAGMIFIVLLVGSYFSAGLVALPFNDRLSQRVEAMVLGEYEEPFSWRVLAGDLGLSIAHTLTGLLLWAVVMFCVLLMNLIPVLGTVLSFFTGLIATAFFLGREMMDGAMSRRRLSFAHKLRVVRSHLALMEGFGIATYLMLWVPGLNFISLPCAVIGGTQLYCELERQGLVPNADGSGPLVPERAHLSIDS